MPPSHFADLQKKVDKSWPINLPRVLAKEFWSDYDPSEKRLWDYRVFNLEECNEKLEEKFDTIKEGYEKWE
jgi:hypothetical protein